MPKDSVYAQVQDAFVKRAKGDDGAPRLEPNVYADIVVKKVLDSDTKKFWCGGYSGLLKLMVTWLPLALLVCTL
jgi:1-acylglycerone phosphate reductase